MNTQKNELKQLLQDQYKKAYKEGAAMGAISTCVTLYLTLKDAGIDDSALLIKMIKDIAKTNGCNDLNAEAALFLERTRPGSRD